MIRSMTTNRLFKKSGGRKHRGFTLVELIVVLAIIAILAAAGIASVVGYIHKSRYEQNTQNAVTVYQTAQTAISHKSSNGTLDSWTRSLVNDSDRLDISALKNVNDSVHDVFYYTYNPGEENNPLFDLLNPYFYDKTIFNGTITVVFDVSVTHDGFDKNTYSASVIGAFYSSQNPSSTNKNSAGWDASYIDTTKGNGSDFPWNVLPCTDPSFRRNTSSVGYYDGTENSIYVPNKRIGPVVLPLTASFEMEGHIIGPTVDGTEATGYLFNLRNGETLDVTWAIFDEDYTLNNSIYIGDPTVHADHDENLFILLRKSDIAYQKDDDVNVDDIRLSITSTNLENITWSSSYRTSFEDVDNFQITRKTWDGYVNVAVKHGQKELGTYSFPITKTLVTGDGRTGCPNPKYGYYEYSLSLDCMMVRSDETDNNDLASRYRISRLFEQSLFSNNNQNQTPANIYAVLLPASNWTYYSAPNTDASSQPSISATYAARAMDDPVYYTGTSGKADGVHYNYHVEENAAKYDGADTYSGEQNKYKITGRGVVNTLFGDKNYSIDSKTKERIGGTSVIIENNKVKTVDAVITSYRHLYNIRGINNTVSATFKIVGNLDWYVHESVTVQGEKKELYASEVKVFERGGGCNSPVANNGSLQIVSFPGLYKLQQNHILTSESVTKGKIYSINNVQMRASSFKNNDPGFGLVCRNEGTIYNIYTNNLNLILTNAETAGDGKACDYSQIGYLDNYGNPSNAEISYSGSRVFTNGTYVVGGLVGYNKGKVGFAASSETDTAIPDSKNTIVMSNCIVMAGDYWITGDYSDGIGGVIGKNESAGLASGVIKTEGSFVVIGGNYVGGVIGLSQGNIKAQVIAEGSSSLRSEFVLPIAIDKEGNEIFPDQMKCVVASNNIAGGAIGRIDFKGTQNSFSLNGQTKYRASIDNNTGRIDFSELSNNDYNVSVNFPENSLILHMGGNSYPAIGGAIGHLKMCAGDYLSIHAVNGGNILVTGAQNVNCGGAIGYEEECTVTDIYINIENLDTSRIGSFVETEGSSEGAVRTGGAIGYSKAVSGEKTRALNVNNSGTIVSKGTGVSGKADSAGSGGAIGGVSNCSQVEWLISVKNSSDSEILGLGVKSDAYNGTGGAIGGVEANCSISSESTIYSENNGTIKGPYHVGGTIGRATSIYGRLYAENHGLIKSSYQYAGGVVGRIDNGFNYALYNIIQSTLYEDAVIEGEGFVGGSVGKLQSLYDDATVRTIVRGDAKIRGLNNGSYVGGVCGLVVLNGSDFDGIIELEGDGSAPNLLVESAGSQVGGAAGQLYANNATNNAVVKTPSQNPGNRLVLNVSGKDNVGGIIGKLNDNDQSKDINVDLSIAFLPGASVEGSGKNVGGAVGFLVTKNGLNTYEGKISVASVADTTISGTCHTYGNNNVGGAVGELYSCTSNLNEDEIRVDFRYLKCDVKATGKDGKDTNYGSNAGGAIGYLGCNTAADAGSSSTALPIIVMLGSSNIIAADSGTGATTYGDSVGGAIGYNTAKVGKITLYSSGNILGNNYVGGAIGYNKENTNCSVGDILVEITNGQVIGNGNVGGAIGNNGAVSNGKITATVVGSVAGIGDNIGGVIGYNNCSLTEDIVGKITGSVTGAGNIGGIIGYNVENISAAVQGTISGSVVGASDNVAGGIGRTVYKAVSGNVSVIFLVDSNVQENKVHGLNNVGGIVGFNDGTEFSSESGISSNIPAGFSITGSGYVGGAVGKNTGSLKAVESVVNGNIIGTAITGDVGGAIGQNNQAISNVTATLGSAAIVKSSGSYVGGAIGDNKANVSKVLVTSSGYIEGAGRVGGALGQNTGTLDSISVTVEGDICGTGSDGKVGGAIGYNEAVINGDSDDNIAITVNLKGGIFAGIRDDDGSVSVSYDSVGGAIGHSKNNSCVGDITVTFSGNGKVEGGNNIGGIIGFNESTGFNGNLSCFILVNCSVRGYGSNGRVGGAIGYNNGALNTVSVTVNGDVGSVNGGNVGGAIGYNLDGKISSDVETTITGLITSVSRDNEGNIVSSYDNVGGAIGYCLDSNRAPTNTLNTITVKLQGNAVVEGNDNVGGAIGYCENNIERVTAYIAGNSKIKGGSRVGGALGWSCAKYGTSKEYYGDEVNNGKCTGRIKSVTAVISADYALSGTGSCIGGVVGKSGDKLKDGTNNPPFSSCVLQSVTVEINSRYLFDPSSTGTDSTEAACIGGAIGILAEGRIDKVTMRGTGGAVNLGADVFGSEYTYEGPRVSISGAVLIAAKGQSVGGVVGQIGLDGFTGSQDNQNVTLATIDVTKAPQLCVVSVNGSDGIGGWIGKGQGRRGGIGNRNKNKTTYDVTNVKLVYSKGSNVGGFCGCSIGLGSPETFAAHITVTLNDANIIGKSGVGGAFGSLNKVYFSGGEINVELKGRTNIGDIYKNAMPGDNTAYTSICYEAGGAVGRFDMMNYAKAFNAPITVTFNGSLARVYAGGGSGLQSDYGVGGVFGSMINVSTSFSEEARLIIEPSSEADSASQLLVYSENSNAGGVIGFISASNLTTYSAGKECYAKNITVQVESDGGAAGGFVGKLTNMKDRTLKFCYCDVNVIAGSKAYAGGFVGNMDNMGTNGTIDSCYTTAVVESEGSATGGFVGYISSGKIQNCYVGGHTYQGQYISGDGNITGVGSVGGFVGITTGTNTFDNCYTTASVYGSESGVGGFVGNRSDNSTIKNCYCSGTVTGSGYVGSFAGQSSLDNYVRSYVLDGINDVDMQLIGSVEMVGDNNTLNLADKDYINRINTAGGSYNSPQAFSASPFDSSLEDEYPLRAVINKTHVGDWGIPFDGENVYSIASAEIEVISSVDYRKGGVTLEEDEISVKVNGTPLTYGVDFTLSYKNNTAVGEATVIIAGVPAKGYAGVVKRSFTINKVDISNASVTITSKQYDPDNGTPLYDYTGSVIEPTTVVMINGDALEINKDFYLTYNNDSVEGDDDNNNIDLGTVTVTANGMGNYVGTTATCIFIIQGMDISKADISLTGNTPAERIYDGNEKKPGVVVRVGGQTRIQDVDFTVAYKDNKNVGTATITITGQGILRGSTTREFEITTAENSWTTVPSIDGWTWNCFDSSVAQSPVGEARFGNVEYCYYIDEDCNTKTNSTNSGAAEPGGQPVNAGTYYLKAFVERYEIENDDDDIHDGYWTDENNIKHYNYEYIEKIISFTILPLDISSSVEVAIDNDNYCVTGTPITPDSSYVTVKIYSGDQEEQILNYGDDYSVRYINNTNVGEATIIVEGKGNYTGTGRGTFTIRQPIVTFDSCTEIDPYEVSVIFGRTVTRPEDPTLDSGTDEYSWRFDGWYDDEGEEYNFSSEVKRDIKLHAKWVKQYTVTFCTTTDDEAVNNPSSRTVLVDEGTCVAAPSNIVWEGLNFAGWYKNDPLVPVDPETDPSEIGLYDFTTPVNGNMILYAKWQATVSFVITNKTSDEQNPEALVLDYNSLFEIDNNPSYSTMALRKRETENGKWIYDGWYLDEECKKPYDPSEAITGNITLYTKWTRAVEVVFVISASERYSIPVYFGSSATEPMTPTSNIYSNELYDFGGWFMEEECTTSVDFNVPIYADQVYYAKWVEKEFELSFDSNGGTGAMDAIQVTSVTGVAIPESSYTKEGSSFLGWATDPNATVPEYSDKAVITLTRNTTFYAVWSS